MKTKPEIKPDHDLPMFCEQVAWTRTNTPNLDSIYKTSHHWVLLGLKFNFRILSIYIYQTATVFFAFPLIVWLFFSGLMPGFDTFLGYIPSVSPLDSIPWVSNQY